MIRWRDEALLLSTARFGESDAIVELFARAQGRVKAVVKGGAGRRLSPVLQPGDTLLAEWRARLDAHLGTARVEPSRARAAALMQDRDALAALASVCALLAAFLPERDPHDALLADTLALLDRLAAGPGWARDYVFWELRLLAELGFGLDLGSCAATGGREGLVWVSPRSGRAVSRAAGAPYADRLLPLPGFLIGDGEPDMAAALRLTGWFLDHRVAPAAGREAAPAARARLAARLANRARS